jgi:hypothetical protein
MKKILFLLLLAGILSPMSSCAQIKLSNIFGSGNKSKSGSGTNSTVPSLTENEIISGLKEALMQGATNASKILNKLDGYNLNQKVRIPFPEDVAKVAKT